MVDSLAVDQGRIRRAVWRRYQLWTLSRYSKIALASSMRVLQCWQSKELVLRGIVGWVG